MHVSTRAEFLRRIRADMDAVCPNWRTEWPELMVGGAGGSRLEFTLGTRDGSSVTVVLMCLGGFDGERIDGFDRGDDESP